MDSSFLDEHVFLASIGPPLPHRPCFELKDLKSLPNKTSTPLLDSETVLTTAPFYFC